MDCPISGILENGCFSNVSAYFLGSILAGDENYPIYGKDKRMWLAVVKHNIGYVKPAELDQHIEHLPRKVDLPRIAARLSYRFSAPETAEKKCRTAKP